MTVEAVRLERERREAVALERAETLAPGLEIYADGNNVAEAGVALIACESHWDACLVLLAYGKGANSQMVQQ